MSRLVRVTSLVALWVVLWRDLSPANLLSGLVVALAVNAALSLDWAGGRAWRHRVRPLALLRFLGYFGWKLVESNVVIAREVVTPRNRIETGIIAVPLTGCSDQVVTLVANAVSLTPGTLTLDLDRPDPDDPGRWDLYVHVLHLHDIEHARDDVRTLTRLAQAAFPSDARGTVHDPEPTS